MEGHVGSDNYRLPGDRLLRIAMSISSSITYNLTCAVLCSLLAKVNTNSSHARELNERLQHRVDHDSSTLAEKNDAVRYQLIQKRLYCNVMLKAAKSSCTRKSPYEMSSLDCKETLLAPLGSQSCGSLPAVAGVVLKYVRRRFAGTVSRK